MELLHILAPHASLASPPRRSSTACLPHISGCGRYRCCCCGERACFDCAPSRELLRPSGSHPCSTTVARGRPTLRIRRRGSSDAHGIVPLSASNTAGSPTASTVVVIGTGRPSGLHSTTYRHMHAGVRHRRGAHGNATFPTVVDGTQRFGNASLVLGSKRRLVARREPCVRASVDGVRVWRTQYTVRRRVRPRVECFLRRVKGNLGGLVDAVEHPENPEDPIRNAACNKISGRVLAKMACCKRWQHNASENSLIGIADRPIACHKVLSHFINRRRVLQHGLRAKQHFLNRSRSSLYKGGEYFVLFVETALSPLQQLLTVALGAGGA